MSPVPYLPILIPNYLIKMQWFGRLRFIRTFEQTQSQRSYFIYRHSYRNEKVYYTKEERSDEKSVKLM